MLSRFSAFMLATALLATAAQKASALQIEANDFKVAAHRKLMLVNMTGNIDSDAVLDTEEFFQSYFYLDQKQFRRNPKALPVMVIFNSQGGQDLENFQDMAKALLEASDEHYLRFQRPMVFIFEGQCASGCTLLAAHLTRMRDQNNFVIITENKTDFAFHAPQPFDGQKMVKFQNSKEREKEISKLLGAYFAAGVSADFLNANRGIFRRDHPTHYSAAALCQANVGILPSNACLRSSKAVFKATVQLLTDPTKDASAVLDSALVDPSWDDEFDLTFGSDFFDSIGAFFKKITGARPPHKI